MPLRLRLWLGLCEGGLRMCGLLPMASYRASNELEDEEPAAAVLSKIYNSD